VLATIEITTLTTHPCPACGRAHELRAILHPEEDSPADALLGFFGRCPVANRRVWLVARVPGQAGVVGGARLVRMGAPDDLDWEPEEWDELDRIVSSRAGLPPAPDLPSTRGQYDGFRGTTGASELLRRALGCPHQRSSLR
jgi:hypothetical protein